MSLALKIAENASGDKKKFSPFEHIHALHSDGDIPRKYSAYRDLKVTIYWFEIRHGRVTYLSEGSVKAYLVSTA